MEEKNEPSDHHVMCIAVAAHEVNRAYCQAIGETRPLLHWEEVSAEQRASAIDGVRRALAGATPAESHANWLAFKTQRGWVYGPKVDESAKTHPCIMEYDALPSAQKRKDALFLATVRALVTALAFEGPAADLLAKTTKAAGA